MDGNAGGIAGELTHRAQGLLSVWHDGLRANGISSSGAVIGLNEDGNTKQE
jgi:hypothetical protein